MLGDLGADTRELVDPEGVDPVGEPRHQGGDEGLVGFEPAEQPLGLLVA